MVKRTTDLKDPTRIMPISLPSSEDDYYAEVLGFISLALAMVGMISRNRNWAYMGLAVGILSSVNQKNTNKVGYKTSGQGITFSITAIMLSFIQNLMVIAAEREMV